jgi:hypothetical protein
VDVFEVDYATLGNSHFLFLGLQERLAQAAPYHRERTVSNLYDGFEHLCRSLFCRGNDLMPMLTVYCDDSGTDVDSRAAAVAGYISNVAQWALFKKEWQRVLDEFGVDQMHRAELETWNGEFKEVNGWNPKRRRAFLRKLQPIIRRRTKVAIGAAVIKKDFEEVMPQHLKEMYGGVYGWCAQCCIVQARVWCEKPQRQYSDPIDWIFEAGTIGQGQVNKMFESLYKNRSDRKAFHIGGWGFKGKNVIPLQAADVIAYEVFKQTENQIIDGGVKYGIRRSLSGLAREVDCDYLEYWDRNRLIDWIKIWEEEKAKNSEVTPSVSLFPASDNHPASPV